MEMHMARYFPSSHMLAAACGAVMGLALPACAGIPSPTPAVTPTSHPITASTPTVATTPAATSTPTASSTPSPTFTHTPTITPTTPYQEWPVLFSETFDYDTGGWGTGKTMDELATTDASISSGKLIIKVTSNHEVTWSDLIKIPLPSNFYLSADVRKIVSPEKAEYGLVFHGSEEGTYFFYINAAAKQYAVAVRLGDTWKSIRYWTVCGRIDPAGSNRLSVLAFGSSYTLFINDAEVNSFTDDTLVGGMAGIGFELHQAGQYMKLEFDNLILTAPK
jgi:hypothetical protein